MLAELHPQKSFNEIIAELMKSVNVSASNITLIAGHNDE